MLKISFALVIALFCQIGFTQSAPVLEGEVTTAQMIESLNNLITPASDPHRWYFLECVHDRHDCQHHAARAGYHHWYSVHDHQTCHHDHHNEWACYVRD